jgi:hypothetical protein
MRIFFFFKEKERPSRLDTVTLGEREREIVENRAKVGSENPTDGQNQATDT